MPEKLAIAQTAEAAHIPVSEAPSLSPRELIHTASERYGVNEQVLYETLKCESENFIDPTIQSGWVHNGRRERSFGYVQINLDAHPDITYAEAIDPVWAVDYAAHEFAKGNAGMWSCYRK